MMCKLPACWFEELHCDGKSLQLEGRSMITYIGVVTGISEDKAKKMPLSTAPIAKYSWESTKWGAPEGLEAFLAGSAQPHGLAREKRLHSSILKGGTAPVLSGKAWEAITYGFHLRNK